jgi:hypothetical protein
MRVGIGGQGHSGGEGQGDNMPVSRLSESKSRGCKSYPGDARRPCSCVGQVGAARLRCLSGAGSGPAGMDGAFGLDAKSMPRRDLILSRPEPRRAPGHKWTMITLIAVTHAPGCGSEGHVVALRTQRQVHRHSEYRRLRIGPDCRNSSPAAPADIWQHASVVGSTAAQGWDRVLWGWRHTPEGHRVGSRPRDARERE